MSQKPRIKATDIRRKIEAQNYRCAYTGAELTPENVAADHVTPLSRGGTHDLGNIVLAVDVVNKMKNTLSVEEFVAWCRKVVEYHDAKASEAA